MNRIRAIREERAKVVPAAFTATAIARRMGVSDRTLWAWEQGINRPRARHARALARELGATVDRLGLNDQAEQVTDHHHESSRAPAGPATAETAATPTAKTAEAGGPPRD